MKRKNFIRTIMFGFMTLLSVGLLTACGDDDDETSVSGGGSQPQQEATNNDGDDNSSPSEGGGEAQPEPQGFHPINASTRTLLEVTEKNAYTPLEFGEAIGSWSMLSVAGEDFSNLMKRTLKAVAATRIPMMDALFLRKVGLAPDGSRQWALKRRIFTYKSISNKTGNDTTLIGSVVFPTNTVGKPHQIDMLTLYHHQAYFMDSWLPSNSLTLMALHALHNSAVIEPDGMGKTDMNDLFNEVTKGDMSCLQMADCVLAALEVMRQENVTLSSDAYTNNWGTSLGTVSATAFAWYMENEATPDLQKLFNMRASYIGEGPTMLTQVYGCEKLGPWMPAQKYYEGWNPRLPFYMSSCTDDELINYNELKKYFVKLRTMPDGAVNNNVQWLDFYQPAIVKQLISSEDISKMTFGIGNHLITAVVSLMAASQVKDPEDMRLLLRTNNIFVEE